MNWWRLGYEWRLRAAKARKRLEEWKLLAECWFLTQKIRFLSWRLEKVQQLNTLAESYKFQHGENDE